MIKPSGLYLGRRVDEQGERTETPLSFPIDHLTTHALLLGATGSGKTGLGLVLVEDLLLQGAPVLLLDVKGDLSNLLLTFPELRADDFASWIDADAARRSGQTRGTAAEAEAQRWREGLAAWGITEDRIAALRATADFALYTPGSRAGRPVDILARFGAPPGGDPDEAALRAQALASALLGLAGVDAEPLQSREHILLTTLIRHAWAERGALDVPTLIQMVQQPPVDRVGVFDMESFFPQDDRFELALLLNNIIAAPGFARWRTGQPLDIEQLLYTADGKPRATLFYLAHLPEDQRRFFVTLFLQEMRVWLRHQPGTRALRALLYFDEIYGYLPPHPHNPPTKAPLLALIKQGRAAGLGVALATQNPADLDYKGLSNIGAWFLGALRTERDQDRVLEGMEGSLSQVGLTRRDVERALGRLQSRRFLMYNARQGDLAFFESRWAMSYLRGPLTIQEVKRLTPDTEAGVSAEPVTFAAPTATVSQATPRRVPSPAGQRSRPPTVDPDIQQAFLPATVTAAGAARRTDLSPDATATLVYQPALLGVGVVHIYDDRADVSITDQQVWRVEAAAEAWDVHWDEGAMIDLALDDLSPTPLPDEALYASLPRLLGRPAAHKEWRQAFDDFIYRTSELRLWACRPLDLYSRPAEPKSAFLRRCTAEIERQIGLELEEARPKFERKIHRVQARIRRETLELEEDRAELEERRREELLSGAETMLNLLSRRRRSRALSQVSRQRRYVKKARSDVDESQTALDICEEQLDDLREEWEAAETRIITSWRAALDEIEPYPVRPRRRDVEVRFCGLAWFPFWAFDDDGEQLRLPAYVPQA